MPITTIITFNTSSPTDATIDKLNQALNQSHEAPPFVIGSQVQEPSIIQITSEWSSFSAFDALATSPAFQSFTKAIRGIVNSPLTTILARLDGSKFEDGAPPFVEFVKTDFPATQFTSTFQTRIENDFASFETIYRKRGSPKETGEMGLKTGWTEEQDGERSFVVARGWESMRAFEQAVQSEEFKEAIPILMGWGAAFKLVSTA